MSNNYWDDEDDNDDVITGNETESDLHKKLRKKIRSDEKRIKELEDKLGNFTKTDRERSVKEFLEKEGVNPKAARYILKDIEGDISEDAIRDWLDAESDVWQSSKSEGASNVSEEDRLALRQQDRLTEGALTPDRAENIEMRIDQATSIEDLDRIMFSQ